MKFASVRIATRQFEPLVAFYAQLSGVEPVQLAPGFAELRLPGGAVLAISSEELIQRFNKGAAVAAANRSAIFEFEVDDVPAILARFDKSAADIVMEPTVMPWGNHALLLRDPDGNLVNVFSRPAASAN
ncbi:MAG TPA: VOC family protein [Burkholderiaceae bacterium]